MGGVCIGKNQPASFDTFDYSSSGVLTIWGDLFQPDTRTLVIMAKMGGVDFEFKSVDSFLGDYRTPAYESLNPTGTLPTITENRLKCLGGYLVHISFLVNNHPRIKDRLFPTEAKPEIEQAL